MGIDQTAECGSSIGVFWNIGCHSCRSYAPEPSYEPRWPLAADPPSWRWKVHFPVAWTKCPECTCPWCVPKSQTRTVLCPLVLGSPPTKRHQRSPSDVESQGPSECCECSPSHIFWSSCRHQSSDVVVGIPSLPESTLLHWSWRRPKRTAHWWERWATGRRPRLHKGPCKCGPCSLEMEWLTSPRCQHPTWPVTACDCSAELPPMPPPRKRVFRQRELGGPTCQLRSPTVEAPLCHEQLWWPQSAIAALLHRIARWPCMSHHPAIWPEAGLAWGLNTPGRWPSELATTRQSWESPCCGRWMNQTCAYGAWNADCLEVWTHDVWKKAIFWNSRKTGAKSKSVHAKWVWIKPSQNKQGRGSEPTPEKKLFISNVANNCRTILCDQASFSVMIRWGRHLGCYWPIQNIQWVTSQRKSSLGSSQNQLSAGHQNWVQKEMPAVCITWACATSLRDHGSSGAGHRDPKCHRSSWGSGQPGSPRARESEETPHLPRWCRSPPSVPLPMWQREHLDLTGRCVLPSCRPRRPAGHGHILDT